MEKRKIFKKFLSSATAFAIIFSGTFSPFTPHSVTTASAKQSTELNDYGVLTDCKANADGTLYLSKKVCAISTAALDKTNVTKFVVDSSNPSFKAVDGVLYTKDGTRLVRFPNNSSASFTVPSGVKTISQYAFRKAKKLEEIVIPDTVTKIGEGAFYGCSSLSKINIPKKVTIIQPYTFFNCSSLKSIKLPSKLERLGNNSFRNCTDLETVNIPKNITKIETRTFMGCEKLKKAVFPSSIETISAEAFRKCNSLTSVKLPNDIDSLGNYAFYSCKNLKYARLSDNINYIGYNTFSYCDNLKSVTIGKYTNSIAYGAFSNCPSLKNITIPDNVETISSSAFDNSVENFKVSSGNAVFSASDGILYNKNQTTLKKYPCLKVGNYKIPDTVKKIGDNAFINCKYLKNVTITDKIKTISLSSFNGSGITRLNLPTKLERVYGESSNLKSLKKVTIPTSNKRFFVNDDILYCYYNLENYNSSNSSSWTGDENTSNYRIVIYPTGKKGPVTLLEQTLYTSEIPYENQASYFKTASVSSGAAFCTSDNGVITNAEKTEISAIPGNISNCYIGSKIKNLYYIYDYKNYLNGLKKYTVASNNKYYKAKDGVLYNKLLTKLIDYPSQKSGSYTFPKSVLSVNYTAFRNAVKLKEIKLGKNITSCKNLSFENCPNLSKFTIPEGCSVRKLTLHLDDTFAPKLISIPTSLISFKMYDVSDKMREKTVIEGFTNTCAEKTAKTHKLKFVSKGVVPKALKKVKINAYINDRYVKISWEQAADASGYEIYTENNVIKRITDNKITSANIYIGKNSSTVLYIRAYNLVDGKKLYSKAKKFNVLLQ